MSKYDDFSKLDDGFWVIIPDGNQASIIEGGWQTFDEAQEFVHSEVSARCKIVEMKGGKRVIKTPAPAKATARPWTVCSDSDGLNIEHQIDGLGYPVAYLMQKNPGHEMLGSLTITDDEAEANAALIVKAVNAHDKLVAALKACQVRLFMLDGRNAEYEQADKVLITLSEVGT